MRKPGFTLIELILYIGVTAVILVGLVTASWNIIDSQDRVRSAEELNHNGRLALNQITQLIRGASSINTGSSTFASNPGTLVLTNNSTLYTIDTYSQATTLGDQATNVTTLRLTPDGGSSVNITSANIDVTDFTLINLTRDTEPTNIRFQITLNDIKDATNSITLNSAAVIRTTN